MIANLRVVLCMVLGVILQSFMHGFTNSFMHGIVSDSTSVCVLQNLSDLLAAQQRGKYYQQVKAGKYTRLCRTMSALETELGKMEERMHTLAAITERLTQEYPHVTPALRRVLLVYGSRTAGGAEGQAAD
jgi:hypothetical protein